MISVIFDRETIFRTLGLLVVGAPMVLFAILGLASLLRSQPLSELSIARCTQTAIVTAGTTFDFNTFTFGNGTTPVTGSTANTAPNASLTLLGGNQFSVSFDVNLHFVGSISGLPSIQDFTGTIVANGFLTAVPEPATYAMIGLSLGVAGYIFNRQRKIRKQLLDATV